MKKYFFTIITLIIFFISVSCEDNTDKDNPLIGRWRSDLYTGIVETNDSAATAIIRKDIESINKNNHSILQYEFIQDSLFILFNMNNDYKTIGSYSTHKDTINFTQDSIYYYAIKTGEKQFDLYIKDLTSDYTIDSLRNLNIANPENIVLNKAWLVQPFRKI